MLINSLELLNFRQFYGKHKIEFSTDPEKNITLIHAENGVGKTALLNAILWCFFEETTSNFERKKDILNYFARDNKEEDYYVHIEFEEGDKRYVAQREVNQYSGGRKVFRVYQIKGSGNHISIDSPELLINSIIPKDMAGYFFFQGEGVGTINNSADVKDAIRDILGFTIADAAIDDIREIKSEYRRQLKKIDNSTKVAEVQNNLADCEDDLSKLSKEFDEANRTEGFLKQKLQTIEEELRNFSNENVAQQQRNRDNAIEEIERLEMQLKRALERKARLVGRYAVSAFSFTALEQGIDFVEEEIKSPTIPEPYNIQLVKDILHKNECICGAEIKAGTDAFRKVNDLLATAADTELLNRLVRARSQLTNVDKQRKDGRAEFAETLEDISSIEESIVKKKDELEILSLWLKNIDIEDVKEKEKSRENVSKQLQETGRRLGSLTAQQNIASKKRDDLNAELGRISSTVPEVQRFCNLASFAETIEKQLQEILELAEQDSLSGLQSKINDILSVYMRQEFYAEIGEDYVIALLDRKKQPVPKSDGQSLLLSLTFISSLISLARERKDASSNILTSGVIAPFVVDAPFGMLDSSYKANIAEELPKSVDQIVFLLSSSHWEGTVENVIRSRIGREYNMVVEVAAPLGEKKANKISIQGELFDTARYDCDVDMTRIEEVGIYV